MVDLVLDAAAQQAVGLDGVGVALEIPEVAADGRGTPDPAAQIGEGEAALLGDVLPAAHGLDHGIDEGHRHDQVEGPLAAVEAVVERGLDAFRRAHVDDAQAQGPVHLLGGQADTFLGVHRPDHLCGKLAQRVVETLDRFALFPEDGLAVLGDSQHGLWNLPVTVREANEIEHCPRFSTSSLRAIPPPLGFAYWSMRAVLKSVFFLLLAVACFLAGMLVPEQLRSVQDVVLRAAGERGGPPAEAIENALDAARAGTAGLLLEGAGADAPGLRQRRADLLAREPVYRLTGGPAPYLEAFLDLLRLSAPEGADPGPAVGLLLARSHRDSLHRTLGRSSNAVVQALLDTRELAGMTRLQPAGRPGGAPFDGALLVAALLVQGGHFPAEAGRELKETAEAARAGELPAVRRFEAFALDALSLAKRLPHDALIVLAETSGGLSGWTSAARVFRAYPDDPAGVFAALALSGDPAGVAAYLRSYPEEGYEDLAATVPFGTGAVEELLGRNLPRYRRPPLASALEARLGALRPPFLAALAVDFPGAMRLLKFLLFLGAGWCVALALGAAWRGERGAGPRLGRFNPYVLARDGLTGLAGALIAWMLVEPDILRGAAEKQLPGLRLDFAVAGSLESIKSPITSMQSINQVTLLVLVLFFVLQLIIYALCLIKLREINREKIKPGLKLRLLENEDHLFDFGLYVGLGGTVASLIFVAIGIVEASLMAAYASTLFGILFVALLKVFHVRPLRRRLILEAEGVAG